MKKRFSILFLLLAALPAFSLSKPKFTTINGYIKYFGNEPFSFPAFVTDDKRTLSIQVEPDQDFTLKDIEQLYGNHIQLQGHFEKTNSSEQIANTPISNSMKDGTFVIFSYKVIN